MLEFVPFDDRWFDGEPPGRLIPLPANFTCMHDAQGVAHWVPPGMPENVITLPVCTPSFAAVPALSSNT